MRTISSTDNPLVKTVRRLQERAGRNKDDRFVLEGLKLCREALESGVRLEQALMSVTFAESQGGATLIAALERAQVPRARVTERVFRALTGLKSPEGVLAIGRRRIRSLDELEARVVVVPADVRDPGNLGAIARVAEAAGVEALVECSGTTDPFQPKALRGSMGSLLRLPVYDAGGVEQAVHFLRDKGYRIICAVPHGGIDLRDADLTPPLAVILGSESRGLHDGIRDLAHVEVSVPMKEPVDSLNVAVVAGLVLYEVFRRFG